MRVVAEPLQRLSISLPAGNGDIFGELCAALKRDGYILAEQSASNKSALTAFRHFATETGFTQPEGGREYFYRLRISVVPLAGQSVVKLEPEELELRTSYVYADGGKLNSFRKRYPYEHYPGMFDLGYVNAELNRVRQLLENSLSKGTR